MNHRALSLALLTSIFLAAGCAVHNPPQGTNPPMSFFPKAAAFVATEGQLLAIDPDRGEVSLVLESPLLTDVRALARQPSTGALFALTRGEKDPHLVTISNHDGSVREIGPINLPKVDLQIADGLAFDGSDGQLYATAGIARLSDLLLVVDTETAAARRVSRITGTPQRELDALAFIRGQAFGVDTTLETCALFRIDHKSGKATPMGPSFQAHVLDLAWDPAQGRLLAVHSDKVTALTLGGMQTSLPLSSPGGADKPSLAAIATVPDRRTIFVDGFESGDFSQWSSGSQSP